MTGPRFTIMQVLAPSAVGGLERVVQTLSVGLADRGHAVHVAALVADGGPRPDMLDWMESRGVHVHVIQHATRAYHRELRDLRKLMRDLMVHVVHSHGYHADILLGLASRWPGPPIVATVHGFTGGDWKNRVYERLQRRAFRRFAAVVPVSSVLVHDLLVHGVRPERLEQIRNAYVAGDGFLERAEARRALGLAEDGVHIGWIGRMSNEKAPDVFIEAVGRLRPLPLTASLIGVGAAEDAIRRRVAESDLNPIVRLHGLVPNAARYLKAFDVFVLSSRTEGIPIVLLEAMASGVPAVVTRVGGVPEVVGDEEALFARSEDPEGLAAAIRRTLDYPDGAARRASNAQARLQTAFHADEWIARYEALYARLDRQP